MSVETVKAPLDVEPDLEDLDMMDPETPEGAILEDQTPESLKATATTSLFVLLLGVLFVFLNYRPLWHTDLWGHLAYGRAIWQNGGIPETEPFVTFMQGVRFVDTAWLSQLIGYGVMEIWGGVAGMKLLYGLSITFCAAIFLWHSYDRTQNKLASLLGLTIFLAVAWQHLEIVRPQLAGLMAFVFLMVYLARLHGSPKDYWVIGVLFVLWANLHGSFPVGLLLIAGFCVGRAIDVIRRTKRFGSAFYDRRTRHYFLLTQLAAVAALVNPYGLGLYAEVLTFSNSPNLSDIVEWKALEIRMVQGQIAAIAAVLLIVTYRLSPRRARSHEALLLFGFGASALWTSRMILWWAPVAGYCFAPHAAAIWNKYLGRDEPWLSFPHGRWSIVTVVLCWISVAVTPLSGQIIFDREPDLKTALSESTPLGAVEYLKKHPPQGQVFNVCEYGDYLLWAGPPGMRLWTNSHIHLLPRELWNDYMRIIKIEAGYDTRLERAGVNTIVTEKGDHLFTINKSIRLRPEWKIAYEDDRSYVFVRKDPI